MKRKMFLRTYNPNTKEDEKMVNIEADNFVSSVTSILSHRITSNTNGSGFSRAVTLSIIGEIEE